MLFLTVSKTTHSFSLLLVASSNISAVSLIPGQGAWACHRPNHLQESHHASWVGVVGGGACLHVSWTSRVSSGTAEFRKGGEKNDWHGNEVATPTQPGTTPSPLSYRCIRNLSLSTADAAATAYTRIIVAIVTRSHFGNAKPKFYMKCWPAISNFALTTEAVSIAVSPQAF